MKLFRLIFRSKNSNQQISEDGKRKVIEGVFGEEDRYNQFYGSASLAYRFLSFVLILCFLFCIISASFANADSFSFQNLEYILRNFAMQLEANEDDSIYAIKYNPDTSRNFSIYKNGLAVCGNNALSIFSATGILTANENFDYLNPVMVSGDKYVLVYDALGSSFTVYNSFSSVYSSKLDHIILGGAIADNGCFALITGSDEYNSAVEVYNDDFELIYRVNKNGYVTSVDISDSQLLICTSNVTSDGSYSSEIMLFNYATDKNDQILYSVADLPVFCALNGNSITVVCEKSVYSLGYNGFVIGEYTFNDQSLSDFSCHSGNILLLFKNNGFGTEHYIVCLDEKAQIGYEYQINETVFAIELFDSSSFVLTEKSILKFTDEAQTETGFSGADHNTVLIAFNPNEIYICASSEAPLIKIDK